MTRRDFLERTALLCAAAGTGAAASLNPPELSGAAGRAAWRAQFPALEQKVGGNPLTYLDSAATTHRPWAVIEAVSGFYARDNANPSPVHALARRAGDAFAAARAKAARLVGAADPLEIVFTRGTTEAINLVARSLGGAKLGAGDVVLLGRAEHASNMMPWQAIARERGARVEYFGFDESGAVDLDDFRMRLEHAPRVVAFSHVSNVLGIINPVREMTAAAHAAGALVLVDAAQSVPHIPVHVADVGCDFLAFSGHKMCGPMGTGVLWARRALLGEMPPYQYGSNMAHEVRYESMHLSDAALKFGAGTPSVADAVGLGAAIDFLQQIGADALRAHEQQITAHMLARLSAIPSVRLLGSGSAEERIAVFSFVVHGRDASEVARALDAQGIAVRAGDLASLPLLEKLGVHTAVRASCYLYTTPEEVDRFCDALA